VCTQDLLKGPAAEDRTTQAGFCFWVSNLLQLSLVSFQSPAR
jgi:hypothetical protein